MPSKPAACARRAASTKRSTTQARSSSVATCTRYAAVGDENGAIMAAPSSAVTMPDRASGAGGRFFDGTRSGRPSAMSRRLLVPLWTSWAAMAAPWRWASSVRRRNPGRWASSEPAICRRSVAAIGYATDTEPTMTRPAPPRARASNHAACASPTVPSPSARFTPIGAMAMRFRSWSDPIRPGARRCPKAVTTAGRRRCRCPGPWAGTAPPRAPRRRRGRRAPAPLRWGRRW